MLNFNTENCVGLNGAVITYLTIHNLSPTMDLVYRIKTTAPVSYIVRPWRGVVDISNTWKVEITYTPKPVRISSFHLEQKNKIEENKFAV